jgi:hypothetical protein
MQRFSDEQLGALKLDPSAAIYATCPFCGGDLAMGYRIDTGNLALGHSADAPPGAPGAGGQVFISGCERFRALIPSDPREFFRILKGRGVKWRKLTD